MHTHTERVKSALRTGVAIVSTEQCLEELVANSLDAGAASVSVMTDFTFHSVAVMDDGCGFTKDNLTIAGRS